MSIEVRTWYILAGGDAVPGGAGIEVLSFFLQQSAVSSYVI